MSPIEQPQIHVETAAHSQIADTIINNPGPTPSVQRLQLDLYPVEWNPDNISRFRYTSQGTPLFGRVEELRQLREFVHLASKPFCWWIIGGPGGSGKSRLAFELALELKKDPQWESGFVKRGDNPANRYDFLTHPPDGWPNKPTLLIIDYFTGEADKVGAAIAILARHATGPHPLRMLLLEREVSASASWWATFSGTGERLSAIENSRYHPHPLNLPPLPLEDMAQVIRSWPGHPSLPKNTWMEMLKRSKVDGRPLYAAFLADALQKPNQSILHWDENALIHLILKREKERWETNGIIESDQQLLILATLCGGLDTSKSDLPKHTTKLLHQSTKKHTTPAFEQRCQILTGHAIQHDQPRIFP